MPTSSDLHPGHTDPGADLRVLAILAQASTPGERLSQPWLCPTEPELGRDRFEQWTRAVADGDAARAQRVLADRGLTIDRWRAALGGVRLAPGAADALAGGSTADADLPGWALAALALHRMVLGSTGPTHRDDGSPPSLVEVAGPGLPDWADPDQPWQFYPGFRAWLDGAAREVADWVTATTAPITAQAQRELVMALARRMLPVAGPHLMAEVQRRSRAAEPRLFAEEPAVDWLRLWTSLPVLARLQGTVWRQWRSATAELVGRIAADLPTLAPGTAVLTVATGAGDQHGDGRGVAAVHLDDGSRWFLKPRSAGPHPVVAGYYAAMEVAGGGFGLTLPESHTRAGYTWVREVLPGTCRDVDQIADYFTRAGAALGVLQALGATDLHHENFIATTTQPVLVDLETAIGPGSGWRSGALPDGPPGPAADQSNDLADTPTATSMVTSPVDGPPGTASVDIGALAGPSQRPTPYEVATLVATDDGPRLRRRRLPLATGSSLPADADGVRTPVMGFTEEVVAGYVGARARLAAMPDPAAPLTHCAPDADVRFVARPTQVYTRLAQQGLTAEALADGVARELVLERLWRAHGTCPSALIEAEHAALRDLDVPLFTVPIERTDLITDRGVTIPAALAASPADEARRRLNRLRADPRGAGTAMTVDHGADDLRAALFAVVASPDQPPGGRQPPNGRPAAPVALLEPVATLLSVSTSGADGTPTWAALAYDPTRHRWHHERLGPSLLGEAGIGLALVTAGSARAVEVGTQALLASADRLARLRLGWVGADAFTGPAGTLYALARGATLTGDARLDGAMSRTIPHVLAAADHPPAGPTIDPVAGGLLALTWVPPGPLRDAAIDPLLHRLADDPHRPSHDDDVPDAWARSLPSTFAGRLLAAHRWGLTDVVRHLLPLVRPAATAEDWRPTDAAVLALVGEPLSAQDWQQEWLPRATSSHRLLDCIHVASTHVRSTGDSAWDAALTVARDTFAAHARRNSRWFGDVLAPDTRNLSAVHGLAAITLLGIADTPAAPDARTFG